MAKCYRLYGCRVESDFPLCVPLWPGKNQKPDIRILKASGRNFFTPSRTDLSKNKIQYLPQPDGSVEILFFDSHECRIVPNGKTVYFKSLAVSSNRKKNGARLAFLHFLRNNILSFCLLKFGVESLHGSAVVIQNKAVGLIGQSGYGKSTLAASFLKAGYPVLTDDLLAVKKSGREFKAAPGPAHLKLYPETAKQLLPKSLKGIPMNRSARKLVFPLKNRRAQLSPIPLSALYVLHPRFLKRTSPQIRVRPFAHQEAVINLIRAAHNLVAQDPVRIRKQFVFASGLASQVPVRAVSYPRNFERVTELRDTLLLDLSRVFHKPRIKKSQKDKALFH